MTQILVLESHGELRRVLGEALETEGYRVRLAASVVEALTAVSDTRPDLVLCDLRSASTTSQSFLEWFRAQPAGAGVPIVLMSADLTAPALAQQHGYARLSKPFDLDELLRSVSAVLTGASAEAQPLGLRA